MIGVYIHIPYCRTICPYCDFVKRPTKGVVPDEFIRALCGEIAAYDGPRNADSVFFGGGTPSLIEPRDLETVLAAVRRHFALSDNTEITLEANPDDITGELVRRWTNLGVNRVSLGVQSFNEDALRYLGRRHDADGARRACAIVGRHFVNWNIDLIFGAPPYGAWRATLEETTRMGSTHVSAYGLTYEAGTPFGKRAEEAIDEDLYLEQYAVTLEMLNGFDRYEVSNYAKPGRESVHNLHYWRNEEYAGFGPGAYSFVNGVRARNHAKLEDYLDKPGEKSESLPLSDEEVRVETVIQHLRLREGISRSAYRARFDRELDADFAEPVRALSARDLLADDGETLRPTRRGFELNNEIGLALVSAGVL
ncbi:MAG: radical SAM family heme chaperone HemW [Candidatus Hydrogenedentes bacterium]|nr:radical SAM family heme chaperone HemW [Candidatus Hydrogenedentota bacterium]